MKTTSAWKALPKATALFSRSLSIALWQPAHVSQRKSKQRWQYHCFSSCRASLVSGDLLEDGIGAWTTQSAHRCRHQPAGATVKVVGVEEVVVDSKHVFWHNQLATYTKKLSLGIVSVGNCIAVYMSNTGTLIYFLTMLLFSIFSFLSNK